MTIISSHTQLNIKKNESEGNNKDNEEYKECKECEEQKEYKEYIEMDNHLIMAY